MQTVRFIAPNGARVNIKDWQAVMRAFSNEVVLHIIYNDPILGA